MSGDRARRPELLRASHAKPWKDSSDRERLDVYNGFLLAVHVDALFGQGLMTLREDGVAEISPHLRPEARSLVIGDGDFKVSRVADGHRLYLAYHRETVFRRR